MSYEVYEASGYKMEKWTKRMLIVNNNNSKEIIRYNEIAKLPIENANTEVVSNLNLTFSPTIKMQVLVLGVGSWFWIASG